MGRGGRLPLVVSTAWPLTVHAAMLRSLPPCDALQLAAARGYSAIFWELTPANADDAVAEIAGTAIRASCLGFAHAADNAVAPERAVALAEAIGAPCVRVYGASMYGQSYVETYDQTTR